MFFLWLWGTPYPIQTPMSDWLSVGVQAITGVSLLFNESGTVSVTRLFVEEGKYAQAITLVITKGAQVKGKGINLVSNYQV